MARDDDKDAKRREEEEAAARLFEEMAKHGHCCHLGAQGIPHTH